MTAKYVIRFSFSLLLTLPLFAQGEFAAPVEPYACTSFAVYTAEPIYGMNFDYTEVDVRFVIYPEDELRVFMMEFEYGPESYVPIVGMNSDGLFSSCQMLYPAAPPDVRSDSSELFSWELHINALFLHGSVAEVLDYLDERRLIDSDPALHNHIADAQGNAVVVEPTDARDEITTKQGSFSVMTNFPNNAFRAVGWEQVEGVGADRYRESWRYITEQLSCYNLEHALATLEGVVMNAGEWATRCSTVYLPEQNLVYIALAGDFSRIWEVSLLAGTVSTWRGFETTATAPLGPGGLMAAELPGYGE